ncbi:hypothetical protein CVU37_13550 [candidate division BRC1 bacterium HGW-BRC1-1]|jgi:hypothetical protein|nr:MAG: hypothetical protein CVU37_13550 [candidate division BRC1 bacterium HGW-BRC1-1]
MEIDETGVNPQTRLNMHSLPSRVIIPIALFLGIAAIYFPALEPGTTFSGMDFLNLLLPHMQLVKGAFAQGQFPLWNWYTWGGCPLMASMLSATFYPLLWPFLPFDLATVLPWFAAFHLTLAAGAAYHIARHFLSLDLGAAFVAAFVFGGSGFFLGHLEQINVLASMAWSAWLFAGLISLPSSSRHGWIILAAFSCAVLAGHPQYPALALLFGVPAMMAVSLLCGVTYGKSAWDIVLVTGAVGTALCLCAIQLLPTAELAGLSERVWPYADRMNPALDLRNLAALFSPRYYNTLAQTSGQPLAYSEAGLYGSMIAAPLVLIAIIAALIRRCFPVLLIAGVAIIATLFASGHQGGIAPILSDYLPLLKSSRGAARALLITALCYAVLAGYGWHHIQNVILRPFVWRNSQKQLASILVVAIILVDFAWVHFAEIRHRVISSELIAMPLKIDDTLGGELDQVGRIHRFMANDSDFYLDSRGEAVFQRRFRLQPNMNVFLPTALLDGYEEGLLPPRHYANFLRRMNRNLRSDRPDAALLALMGCNRIFTEYPITDMGADWHLTRPPIKFGNIEYRIWKSDMQGSILLDADKLGPAADSDEADQDWWGDTLGKTPDGYPLREQTQTNAAIAHPADHLTSTVLSRARTDSTHIRQRDTNSIRFNLDGADPRQFVFLQSWYPGWKIRTVPSTVESRLIPISPVFSKVNLPPAISEFSLEYKPFSFRLGAFLTLLSSVGLAIFAFFNGRGRTGR